MGTCEEVGGGEELGDGGEVGRCGGRLDGAAPGGEFN